jgi:hypothetical protein
MHAELFPVTIYIKMLGGSLDLGVDVDKREERERHPQGDPGR